MEMSHMTIQLRSVEKQTETVEYQEVDLQTVNSMQNQNPQENRSTVNNVS